MKDVNMRKARPRPKPEIPERFSSPEEAGEFWDTHDLADYWDQTEQVPATFELERHRFLVSIEPSLAQSLSRAAHERGVSMETLANLWLTEKIAG